MRIRYTRVRHGHVQAPVLLLRHPVTGRRVMLIGVMHVGAAAYYEQIQALIAQAEDDGFVIQFEGVHPVPEPEKAGMTDAEEDAIKAIEAAMAMYKPIAETMGWVGQKEALNYSPDWQGIDITMLELVRLTGAELITKIFGRFGSLFETADDPATPYITRVAMAVAFRLDLPRWIKLPAPARAAILDRRNLKALSGIFEALPTHDVAILWGAAHLPGIGEVLLAQGFEIVEETWLNIGQLPPIFANLRGAYSAAYRAELVARQKGKSPDDSDASLSVTGPRRGPGATLGRLAV